jgi:putative MATE family efflux protein
MALTTAPARRDGLDHRSALVADATGLRLAISRPFLSALRTTALPVAFQSLLSSSRSLIDVVLVSGLGSNEVAAIGYGSRVLFVVMLATVGMADGGAVVIAQFLGRGNVEGARRATALTTVFATTIAIVAGVTCLVFARPLVSIATDDPNILAAGATYLRTVVPMVVPFAVISAATASLRCRGESGVAMRFAMMGVTLHVMIACALVPGRGILPGLGVAGAATATVISTYAEGALFLWYLYGRRHPMAFRMVDVRRAFHDGLLTKIRRVGVPVSLSSTSWATGILVYNLLVARAGSQELTVLSMISPIESAAIAIFIGLSTAAAIMIATSLGSGDAEGTWRMGRALLIWSGGMAVLCCLLLLSAWFWLDEVFGSGIDPATMGVAKESVLILSGVFLFRAMNITQMNGLLRAGGDTVFILKVDLVTQWIAAVPLTFVAALVFHLPFPLILLAINCEEIVKFFVTGWRVLRRRWLRTLVGER